MPEHINTHLAIALILGAFVLGYLLAEWYFDGILVKTERQLKVNAETIDDLLDNDDRAGQLIDKLRGNIQIMDQNAVALLEKNTELQRQVHEYERTFGKHAIASTSYDV